ncbi:tyrosinase central domain-containing protein, partial [Colletotrichum higginsianum]
MWPLTLGVLALQASGVLAGPVSRSTEAALSPNNPEELQKLADLARSAFDETKSQAVGGGEVQKRGSSCAWHNVRVRKEWGTLSRLERLDYIKAVKCLQSRPARTPSSEAPGARSRFDDFVATHINQTFTVHYT